MLPNTTDNADSGSTGSRGGPPTQAEPKETCHRTQKKPSPSNDISGTREAIHKDRTSRKRRDRDAPT